MTYFVTLIWDFFGIVLLSGLSFVAFFPTQFGVFEDFSKLPAEKASLRNPAIFN